MRYRVNLFRYYYLCLMSTNWLFMNWLSTNWLSTNWLFTNWLGEHPRARARARARACDRAPASAHA